jgi:NADPH2:quinone reductase
MNFPFSFKSLAIESPGSPVRPHQRTVESLNQDELLVRVHYASVNKMDPLMSHRNVFQLPQPYVLGFDFSGEVIQPGSAGQFKAGDQVFGGTLSGGCFAEYVVVRKESVLLRDSVPASEACAFGVAYITAFESLVMTGNAQARKGKSIYIAGAAGGVGHFATQIAKLHGMKVIGSAGKAETLDLLRKLHVDHVIDYARQDVVGEIMKLTGGKGTDIVYDSTYTQSSYNVSSAVVASGGEYIRLGTQQQMQSFGLEDMTKAVESRGAKMLIADPGRYRSDPLFKPRAQELDEGMKQAVRWYTEGKLKPLVTQVIPFDASALQRAFEDFLAGKNNVGKIVVRCGP